MANDLLVGFWNLENLFAPDGFPAREPWIAQRMAKDLAGWTEPIFARKLTQLATGILQMNGGRGPDLLGVCEVENRFVLERLTERLNAGQANRRYDMVHADATRDQRGIDTAFLFDRHVLTADPTRVFSHWVMRRTGTRDITQVTFTTTSGNTLVALCNHWPSRSGGAYESRGYRMTAGETLAYWHERIWEETGSTKVPVIALGDFNDDPFDESLVRHARATRERPDVITATTPHFYNLAWNYLRQEVTNSSGHARTLYGSLYYNRDGFTFDQILVGRGLLLTDSPLRVREETARIEALPPMIDPGMRPEPIRFGLPKGDPHKNINEAGFSDHFPVSVVIEEG